MRRAGVYLTMTLVPQFERWYSECLHSNVIFFRIVQNHKTGTVIFPVKMIIKDPVVAPTCSISKDALPFWKRLAKTIGDNSSLLNVKK